MKTFFFWRSPQFGQKKRLICQATGNFQVIFGAKLWRPPRIILSSYAHERRQNDLKLLLVWYLSIFTKGGVEDTRLEAKDTKKFRGQGQGQPF